jgi:predicted ABC-type ATPase
LRDNNVPWMQTAQQGVESFVAHACVHKLAFATETVFSHWLIRPDGRIESKIDKIIELQQAGYFVLLFFVGLSSAALSIARVQTRVAQGGHHIPFVKLEDRFPRTQKAIKAAAIVADATIMVDNSRSLQKAFSVCRIQLGSAEKFDIRTQAKVPKEISAWLDILSPLT